MIIDGATTLQDHFETCLKQDGLHFFLPDDRKESLFNRQLALAWFGILWASQTSLILHYTHFRGWIAAVSFTPVLFIVFLTLLIIILSIRYFREIVAGKGLDQLVGASTFGGLFLVGFPILIAFATGIYLRSFLLSIIQMGLNVLAMAFTVVLHTQRFRLHSFIELVISAAKVLSRSATHTLVLLPVLLVIVLLSLFSEDLWKVLSNLSAYKMVIGSVLLGGISDVRFLESYC